MGSTYCFYVYRKKDNLKGGRTMKIFTTIISNVLTALYQPFWFAVILSVLFMFVYEAYPSIKRAAKDWISWFKSDPTFRRTFLLVFYTVMILFRTLLNRNMWANPVSNVIGVWGLYITVKMVSAQ